MSQLIVNAGHDSQQRAGYRLDHHQDHRVAG
jgi:hypothetical protein